MPLFLSRKAFRDLMSICGSAPARVDGPGKGRGTPEEAKARRKAYRRRKAAEAARRRNRK